MASESQAPSQPLGLREDTQRPTATVSKPIPQDNVFILEQTPQLIALLT
jgi:uracil phosphoribosyltransferase